MPRIASVKVSNRYQIALPSAARQRLNIQSGDRLLVDVQDGVLVLIPQPENYVKAMAGLHKEVWMGVDTTKHLQEERAAWNQSTNG
ncbi:AbrB/MazE/SpoVT family DNA-binding domain-containing protein [soil metagenome]